MCKNNTCICDTKKKNKNRWGGTKVKEKNFRHKFYSLSFVSSALSLFPSISLFNFLFDCFIYARLLYIPGMAGVSCSFRLTSHSSSSLNIHIHIYIFLFAFYFFLFLFALFRCCFCCFPNLAKQSFLDLFYVITHLYGG